MPLERLKEFAKSVRVTALEANGFRTVADLQGVTAERLQQIHGIGPASASQAVRAVNEVCVQLQRLPLEIPSPGDIGPQHTALLRACYQRIRCRSVSQGLISELRGAARTHEDGLRNTRRVGAIWKRLFQREKTEPAVAAAFEELSRLNASADSAKHLADAKSILESLRPPIQFQSLAGDYQDHYADYFAVLDKFLDSATAADSALRGGGRSGRQGSIPAQIADRVEAVSLCLEGLDVDLRGYQEFGAKYLVHQQRTVLGDEMGLGKTIQALAAMVHLKNTEGASHFLVVCPASIVGNWIREIQNRTRIPVRLLHGESRDAELRSWQRSGGVAIASYDTLRFLRGMPQTPIHLLVADEAHYVKNPQAQRSIGVQQLASISDRLVLMTGTALENHPREFVNLVRVCNSILGNQLGSETASPVSTMIGAKRFERMVAPVYLRRNQEDVLKELPECIEIDELVTLPEMERRAYFQAVDSGNVMAMRQAAIGQSTGSAKLQRLAELVEEYRSEGKKLVVFSFFLRALNLVGELLGEHSRIDGSVPANQRMTLIDAFNGTPGFAALICQISAGGVGINLQSASAVVLLEPQFKPTTEWQAIKRVHRMGQSSRVVVHRFLARETVDESLRMLVGKKTELFNSYARESAIKNASPAAVDTSDAALARRLLEMELARRNAAKAS